MRSKASRLALSSVVVVGGGGASVWVASSVEAMLLLLLLKFRSQCVTRKASSLSSTGSCGRRRLEGASRLAMAKAVVLVAVLDVSLSASRTAQNK